MVGLMMLLLALIAGCSDQSGLPSTNSDEYIQTVSLFYSAVARMELGEDRGAEYRLLQATSLAPGESALWYNLGLLSVRRSDVDGAAAYLERAQELSPNDGGILLLSGIVAGRRNEPDRAETLLRSATTNDPSNLRSLYALEQLLSDKTDEESAEETTELIDRILSSNPNNLAARIEKARLEIRTGRADLANETADTLYTRLAEWTEIVAAPISALRRFLHEGELAEAADQLQVLENVLSRFPEYRRNLRELALPPTLIAEAMSRFLRLPNPRSGASYADLKLEFARQTVELETDGWNWVGVPVLTDDGIPILVTAGDGVLHVDPEQSVAIPSEYDDSEAKLHSIVPFDYDYDFRMDLAVAGDGGFRLLRLTEVGEFRDVTSSLELAPLILNRAYEGGWAFDLDADGDMDLILSARNVSPVVLRNNGDGSFQAIERFAGVRNVLDMVWLDADSDGDSDILLLHGDGALAYFRHDGAGVYTREIIPVELPRLLSISTSDLDYDGLMDLLALTDDYRLVRISPQFSFLEWLVTDLASLSTDRVATDRPTFVSLYTGDLDNNGTLDIVATVDATTHLMLAESDGGLVPLEQIDDFRVFEVMDLVGVGRLDLVGLDSEGRPVQMMNMAQNAYRSRTIELRTATNLGDRRINSYGIGGTIELTAGLHFQKRPITGPIVHFGLGNETLVDAVRVIWPNGVTQPLYDLESDQAILAREGLNASCPWLYTHDGQSVRFVEDFLMRSPLGYRISETETMALGDAEDRIKIGREQLAATDGVYDLRLAAELWETVYVDHLNLVAVDHPEGTEFYLNEVFSDPPPSLEPVLMGSAHSIEAAWDDAGKNVTEVVRERDGDYVTGFTLEAYLGQAETHYLEIELGSAFTGVENAWLVLEGWLRPGNSTTSLAMSQARRPAAPVLALEYLDEDDNWKRSDAVLGIPYGMFKSLLINLDDALPADVLSADERTRVRIRSNLEIYWDHIFFASGRAQSEFRQQRLEIQSTQLRFRGFSAVDAPERWSPELPDYDRIASRQSIWSNLEGYYTRYGEVDELIEAVDNRYVLMSAGDELIVRFTVPDPPPHGWIRDFVFVGNGWTKDGSINTMHSRAVLPLPSHERPYPPISTSLENDPVYRKHSDDWLRYHTRYVGSEMPVRATN